MAKDDKKDLVSPAVIKAAKPRMTGLAPGQRVLVHLSNGEAIEGTVWTDTESVTLDRRSGDASVHPYSETDAYGRANRVRANGSQCELIAHANTSGKNCPHCGGAI